jgi:nucleotide-binding universal stress UspA family protein
MKKILFPTNFTELSFNAFIYALDYASKTKAKLIIYHTFNPANPVNKETQKFYEQIDIENFISKKDKFAPFEQIIASHGMESVPVKYIVEEGLFIDCIRRYIEKREDKIDLVIMGTHTLQNRLFELFMETKTLAVLEEIDKPVLAIPEKANFDGSISDIVFLVDYREDEKAPLADLIDQAKMFGAKIHVLHIDLAHGESIAPLMETFKNSLALTDFENVIFKSIDSIDIKESVTVYCDLHHIDMLCLINHRRNFYQRLYSYSLTRDLLNHVDIPIMAIYRD